VAEQPIPRDPQAPRCPEPGCIRDAHPTQPDAHVKYGPSHTKASER
jgi:hypothetical protein